MIELRNGLLVLRPELTFFLSFINFSLNYCSIVACACRKSSTTASGLPQAKESIRLSNTIIEIHLQPFQVVTDWDIEGHNCKCCPISNKWDFGDGDCSEWKVVFREVSNQTIILGKPSITFSMLKIKVFITSVRSSNV